MRFNAGSVCPLGCSQPSVLFYFTQLLQSIPHPVHVFRRGCKMPQEGLDPSGFVSKLNLKRRGIQRCFVWLISVWDTYTLPALDVSCKNKEWFCITHNALCFVLFIQDFMFSLSGPWWSWESTKWSFSAVLGNEIMKSWFDLLIHLLLHFSKLFLKNAEISSNSTCKLFLKCLYSEIWNNYNYKMQWNIVKGLYSLPLCA